MALRYRTMKYILLAVFVLGTVPATALAQSAPQGDPKVGAQTFAGKQCRACHGDNGEGGFGPDLAGRALTFEQYKRALRHPWGVMPKYAEAQISDEQIAGIRALMTAKPPVKEIGHWHWPAAPASAPYEQRVYMQVTGCSQCHEPENKWARGRLGAKAKDVDYEYFRKMLWEHTSFFPRGNMGDYSPDRLSEDNVRAIYKFMVEDLGLRAAMGGNFAIAAQGSGNTSYTLTVTNLGEKGKGLAVEGITVFVPVPKGSKVVTAAGGGYKGVQPLASLGLLPAIQYATHPDEKGAIVRPKADLDRDVMVWKISKMAATEKVQLTFTLSGAPTADLLGELEGSTVYWDKPGRTAFGQKLAYIDTRTPDKGDHERIPPPRPPAPATN